MNRKGAIAQILVSLVVVLIVLGIYFYFADKTTEIISPIYDLSGCAAGILEGGCKYSCDSSDTGKGMKRICTQDRRCCVSRDDVTPDSVVFFEAFMEHFRDCDASMEKCHDALVVLSKILKTPRTSMWFTDSAEGTNVELKVGDVSLGSRSVEFATHSCTYKGEYFDGDVVKINLGSGNLFYDEKERIFTTDKPAEGYKSFTHFEKYEDGACAFFKKDDD